MKYLLTILVVSILVLPSVSEARSGRVTIRHDGYNSTRNQSNHHIVPTVPLGQGNRLSEYQNQGEGGWVRSFPVRTYIPRRNDEEER